ncbi:unnamed protein product [Discula destructiva]
MAYDLLYSDATELARLIRAGKVTAVEVVQAHLDRIQAVDAKLNSIVTINKDALASAKEADAAVQSGQRKLGPLHGVPFTVKDSIDTAGVATQRGSPIFRGRIPDADAVSVARIKAAGAILLAKTNLPEFSYATESTNPLTGRTNNPWNLDRTPGGSSGGEAAAIAAGLSPIGLGTDVAISVRGPAAQTGIAALKPTHGRVPMTGVWPRAPRRFWHTGPMARSVRDLALAYSILAGPDGLDAYSSTSPGWLDAGVGSSPSRQVKVGWLTGPGFGPVDAEVRRTVEAAAEALRAQGVHVEQATIPALEQDSALDIYFSLVVNDMKPGLLATIKDQPDHNLGAVARSWLTRKDIPMDKYLHAEQAVERLKDGFADFFKQYDALLCQVLPIPAHEHGLAKITVDGQTLDATHVMAATVPFNVTGLPALSMRFGTSETGLPISVQLVSSWMAESTVLHLASLLESVSSVKNFHPRL